MPPVEAWCPVCKTKQPMRLNSERSAAQCISCSTRFRVGPGLGKTSPQQAASFPASQSAGSWIDEELSRPAPRTSVPASAPRADDLPQSRRGWEAPATAQRALNWAFRLSVLAVPVIAVLLIWKKSQEQRDPDGFTFVLFWIVVLTPLFLVLAVKGVRFGAAARDARIRGIGIVVFGVVVLLLAVAANAALIAVMPQGVALLWTDGIVVGLSCVIVGALQVMTGYDLRQDISFVSARPSTGSFSPG